MMSLVGEVIHQISNGYYTERDRSNDSDSSSSNSEKILELSIKYQMIVETLFP